MSLLLQPMRTMASLNTNKLLLCSRSLLPLQQVSFASIVGLFCLCSRSLLPLQQVSFASIVGLFCLYSRSLLSLQQVSFASIVGLFCPYSRSLLTRSTAAACSTKRWKSASNVRSFNGQLIRYNTQQWVSFPHITGLFSPYSRCLFCADLNARELCLE